MTKKEICEQMLQGKTLQQTVGDFIWGQDCLIFKAEKFSATDDVIYIPDVGLNEIPIDSTLSANEVQEISSEFFTGMDFIEECQGNIQMAERLFWYCDWQHPSSALPEIIYDEEE